MGLEMLSKEDCKAETERMEMILGIWRDWTELLDKGGFVLFNTETREYEIVEPGMPCTKGAALWSSQ